jgi:hypothetical protein
LSGKAETTPSTAPGKAESGRPFFLTC